MLESLSVFESHLSRLPDMGQVTIHTIPDVFKSAQSIVYASDKLNALVKAGTNRALEEQIDAEVGDGEESGTLLAEVWRNVGADYRETLRVSDELVRNMTGFLLGVGKVLKETAALAAEDAAHGHARNMSAGHDLRVDVRSPEPTGRRSVLDNRFAGLDGRTSRESRRSADHTSDALKRLSGRSDGRPSSRLNAFQDRSPERAYDGEDDRYHSPARKEESITPATTRRLLVPRDRDGMSQPENLSPTRSQDNHLDYEPTPTPTSRTSGTFDRARTLPPIAAPKPLANLPTETILRGNRTTSGDHRDRKKTSTASPSTVRAPPTHRPSLSSLIAPVATTAVTAHSVTNSPETALFPLSRTLSNATGSSGGRSVTFSRSSIMTALSGLKEQHSSDSRKRTISTTSDGVDEAYPAQQAHTAARPGLAHTDTERDPRRRTIGTRTRISLDDRREVPQSYAPPPSNSSKKDRRRTLTEIFR